MAAEVWRMLWFAAQRSVVWQVFYFGNRPEAKPR
jgi:hypothetical protein